MGNNSSRHRALFQRCSPDEKTSQLSNVEDYEATEGRNNREDREEDTENDNPESTEQKGRSLSHNAEMDWPHIERKQQISLDVPENNIAEDNKTLPECNLDSDGSEDKEHDSEVDCYHIEAKQQTSLDVPEDNVCEDNRILSDCHSDSDDTEDKEDEVSSVKKREIQLHSQTDIIGLVVGTTIVKAKDKANVQIGCNITNILPSPSKPPIDREEWVKIIDRYKHEESWMYPFQWDKTVRLESKDYYVDLNLDVMRADGVGRKVEKAELEQLFDPVLKGGERPKRVIIRGDAGYGKSILCQKLVYNWSHGIPTVRELPPDSVILILYKLRMLSPKGNIEEEIFKLIHSHYSPKTLKRSPALTRKVIASLGKDLVIVLDGYDEISKAKQKELKDFLLLWKRENESAFLHASFLVTSRPTNEVELLSLFEKQFFIGEFNEESATKLVNKFFWNTHSDFQTARALANRKDKINWAMFMETLVELCKKNRIKLRELSPLVLFMICWVTKQCGSVDLLNSDDILYNCIFHLAKHCNTREGLDYSDDLIEEVLHLFGMFCLHCKGELVISQYRFEAFFRSHYPFVVFLGILKSLQIESDQDMYFEPVHKSFFEALERRSWNTVTSSWEKCSSPRDIEHFLRRQILSDSTCELSIEVTFHVSEIKCIQIVLINPRNVVPVKNVAFKWNDDSNKATVELSELSMSESSAVRLLIKWKKSRQPIDIVKSVVEAIPQLNQLEKFEKILNCFNGLQTEFVFAFNSFLSTRIKEIICPKGTNLYYSKLRIRKEIELLWLLANGSTDYKAFCCCALENVFGVTSDLAPVSHSATSFFKGVEKTFMKRNVKSPEIRFFTSKGIISAEHYLDGKDPDIPEYKWKDVNGFDITCRLSK